MNYFSGVDHGTSDQGASLLTGNPLSSAMDSQSRIKGVYYCCCCCCYFFVVFCNVILFYFLLVISCNVMQRANKVVDCSIYSVAPIDSWLFSIATYWNACSDLGTRDSYSLCNFVSQA